MLKESSLPDHPMDPFIRILGEVIDHQVALGDHVRWRIATQTVIPSGSTETLIRQVEVVDEAGNEAFVAPGLEIPPREPDLTRFDNQGEFLDFAYEPVIAAEELEPGNYLVRAKLTSKSGAEIARAELPVQIGRNAKLLHRIEGIPKGKGMVRVGDVDGDGCCEVVHALNARCIAAYRLNGDLLWRRDDPQGARIYNTAPLRVFDMDGDGKAEVIMPTGPFGELNLTILDGATGKTLREIPFPGMREIERKAMPLIERLRQGDDADLKRVQKELRQIGHAVQYKGKSRKGPIIMYGAKIFMADFTGRGRPCDLLIQVGEQNCTTLIALDTRLNELWRHFVDDGYGGHNPYPYDVDGDGRDEVAVGTRLIDHDGKLLWKKPFDEFAAPWEDDHIDQCVAGPFGPNGEMVIVYSCRVCVDALTGKTLWMDPTWHGQEAYAAKMRLGDGYQFLFQDREYRNSHHLCHGAWFDVRDAEGDRLWDYRFGSMVMPRMLDWNGDGLYEVAIGLDLQRNSVRPNLGIFDGFGRLIAVLPRYGFGADIDGDGYDELISSVRWQGARDTIEIFGLDHPENRQGLAKKIHLNDFAYNEMD